MRLNDSLMTDFEVNDKIRHATCICSGVVIRKLADSVRETTRDTVWEMAWHIFESINFMHIEDSDKLVTERKII